MHTRDVKQMSRMDYVRGIKVTGRQGVLGNYTRAAVALQPRRRISRFMPATHISSSIFFAPPKRHARRTRHLLKPLLDARFAAVGVVAGPSNAMPREWQRALRVCATAIPPDASLRPGMRNSAPRVNSIVPPRLAPHPRLPKGGAGRDRAYARAKPRAGNRPSLAAANGASRPPLQGFLRRRAAATLEPDGSAKPTRSAARRALKDG